MNQSLQYRNEPRILLVDDDDADVRTVRRAFERKQFVHELIIVKNGQEALARLRGIGNEDPIARPLLILLDLNMPNMSGIEFLDALRSDQTLTDHVVFVLSTSESDIDRKNAYLRHVAGYISKGEIGKSPDLLTKMLSGYLETVKLP